MIVILGGRSVTPVPSRLRYPCIRGYSTCCHSQMCVVRVARLHALVVPCVWYVAPAVSHLSLCGGCFLVCGDWLCGPQTPPHHHHHCRCHRHHRRHYRRRRRRSHTLLYHARTHRHVAARLCWHTRARALRHTRVTSSPTIVARSDRLPNMSPLAGAPGVWRQRRVREPVPDRPVPVSRTSCGADTVQPRARARTHLLRTCARARAHQRPLDARQNVQHTRSQPGLAVTSLPRANVLT